MFEKEASSKFKSRTWGIIIVGFLTMYISCCLGTDQLNLIQTAFAEKFGWSLSTITLPYTIGSYVVIFAAFVYSTIIMKNGTRFFALAAFIIAAAGTALMGVSYSMGGSAAYVLLTVGLFATKVIVQAMQLCVFQICAMWFVKTRGRIIGVIMAACALDSAFSSAGLNALSGALGFSMTYYLFTVILIVVGVFAYFVFVTTPQELGLTPDGVVQKESEKHVEEPQGEYKTKWTLSRLLKCPESWSIMVAFGVYSMLIPSAMGEYQPRMLEVGIDLGFAFSLLAVGGVVGVFASPIYGILMDKIGPTKSTIVLGFFDAAMMIGFYLANGDRVWPMYLVAAGIAMMAGTPILHPGVTMQVFGAKEYQAANRYLSIVVNLIAACAILFMTTVQSITGSFDLAYLIMAVLVVIGTVMVVSIRHSYENEENIPD